MKLGLNSVFKSISIGGAAGAAIDVQGMVWSWGSNSKGELGLGDFEPQENPRPIFSLQGKNVKHLSCGAKFVIALGNDVTGSETKVESAEVSPEKRRIQV